MPDRDSYGGLWDRYLSEERDSFDVLFLGTSMVYCDVNPLLIYEETGVASYVLAGPAESMPVTYYSLREAVKTQSPEYVFLELNSMFEPGHNFDRVNVGYMPWSVNKLRAVFTCEKKDIATLLFPLYGYHGELETALKAGRLYNRKICAVPDPLLGYTFVGETLEIEGETVREEWQGAEDTEYFALNGEYLRKIGEYCREKDIKLVLFLSPTTNAVPQGAMDGLMEVLGTVEYADLLNFSAEGRALGLDYKTDYCDIWHLNFKGAEKFTAVMAEYISGLNIAPTEADYSEELQYYSRLRQAGAFG